MRLYNAPRVPERRYVLAELGSYYCRANGVSCMSISHQALFERFTARLRQELETVQPRPLDAGQIGEQLEAEKTRRDRLTEAYLAGAYNLPEYLLHKNPLDEIVRRLEGQVNNLEETNRRQAGRTEQARYILDNWEDFIESLRADEDVQASNHTLRAVIKHITVSRADLQIDFI